MRYFMTIPEASQLILQAVAIGNGGGDLHSENGNPDSDCGYGQRLDSAIGF